MTWFRLDDEFPLHPKIAAAGGDAAWLHVCAGCYCARYLTDGKVPKSVIGQLSDRKRPLSLAAVLVTVGAWYDRGDYYELHDYLDYNPSKEKVEEERRQARERRQNSGRRGGERSAEVRANVSSPVPLPIPQEQDQEHVELALDVAVPTKDPTVEVFEAWQAATGHHRSVLDPKRRGIIDRALKRYPVADLVDACRGVLLVPHNRGETNGTVYDSIELVLRDAEHIERFRDQARQGPQAPKGAGGLVRAMQDQARAAPPERGVLDV